MKTVRVNVESTPAFERDEHRLGRCAYCDGRCNADATCHDYCRVEYEEEQRSSLVKGSLGRRSQYLGEPD